MSVQCLWESEMPSPDPVDALEITSTSASHHRHGQHVGLFIDQQRQKRVQVFDIPSCPPIVLHEIADLTP